MGASKGWSFDSFLYAVNVCKCDLKVISSLLEEIWKAQVLPDGKGGELLSTPFYLSKLYFSPAMIIILLT